MDPLTGNIILSEMKVELGVYEGDLPAMRLGVVQLPNNPPVGNPNSLHRFLLRGEDFNQVTGYICDCGEAFLGFGNAYDHFFNRFRAPEPELFSTKDNSNNSAGEMDMDNFNATDVDLECSPNMADFDFESSNKVKATCSSTIQMDVSDVDSDHVGPVSTSQEKSISRQVESNSTTIVRNQEKQSSKSYNRCSYAQTAERKNIAEAIFSKYGYPKTYKYHAICASLLDVFIGTFRKYATESRKWKPEENPSKKYINADVLSRASEIHEKVKHYITHKQLPAKMKARTKNQMIISALLSKHQTLSDTYKAILAKQLTVGPVKLNAYLKFVQDFKDFEFDPIPAEVIAEADEYDRLVTSELQSSNPIQPTTLTTNFPRTKKDDRLLMEAIWEKYGLDFADIYRYKCADHLQVTKVLMKQWWLKACVHSESSEKSFYTDLLTDDIRAKAEVLHQKVLESLGGNPGRTYRFNAEERKENSRLLMEGLFQQQGTNLSKQYLRQCALTLDVPPFVISEYHKEVIKRNNEFIENPFADKITEDILKKSKVLHDKVMAAI